MGNKINIYTPIAINEIGERTNNEDTVYPAKENATNNDNLFMVCDGVGGANKGEIASHITTNIISEYIKNINNKNDITQEDINQAILKAENAVEQHINQNFECKGMATTLTLLCINKENGIIAWVGDSRIYIIRDGNIIFKSRDHSLVNYLIDTGEITEEEAKTHPKKNVILKAIQGNEDNVKAEIRKVNDIKADDYFFLCTDGVLENISDNMLASLCIAKNNEADIMKDIQQQCEGKTKDNFSAYIIKIKDNDNYNLPKRKKKLTLAILLISLILLAISLLWIYNN